MKVAFVHSYCRQFRKEFFEIIDNKYDIDFFFYNKEQTESLKSVQQIQIKYIPKLSDFFYAMNLKELLSKKKYDIYISTDLGYDITYKTFQEARRNNKPFILWNEQWNDILHPRRILGKPYENQIVRNSAAILAFGHKAKQFVINRGADRRKVIWIPNAVSEKMIPKSDNEYPVKYIKKRNVLCLGRLIPVKGQEYLIEAFKIVKEEYKDVQLVIAGSGPLEDKLRKIIKKLNVKDVFLPGVYVEMNQKWNLYRKADIVILPSVYHRATEAWGLVMNEAALCSRPLVTTNMTGVANEIVRNGESGYVVTQKDPKKMAEAILRLLHDEDMRNRMGNRAKEIVSSEYSMAKMAKCFDKAIQTASQ